MLEAIITLAAMSALILFAQNYMIEAIYKDVSDQSESHVKPIDSTSELHYEKPTHLD